MDNELRIKKIFGELFEIEEDELDNTLTMDDVEEWDSLMHIQLALALEKEFNIKFTTQQIVDMKSIDEIIRIIAEITN